MNELIELTQNIFVLTDLTVLSDQLTDFESIRPFQAKTFNGTAEYNISVHGTLTPVKMTLQRKGG